MIILRVTKKHIVVSGGYYSRKNPGDKGLSYFDKATITKVEKNDQFGYDREAGPSVFLTAKVPLKNFHEKKLITVSHDELQKWGLL